MKFLVCFYIFLTCFHVCASESLPSYREISIIVTKEGYYPKNFSIFEGEKVKFFVTSTIEDPGCLIIEGHKVFLAANKGKISEAETIFDKSGEYSLYCPSSKINGKIVVLKKAIDRRSRAIASDKNSESMLWMPKEY